MPGCHWVRDDQISRPRTHNGASLNVRLRCVCKVKDKILASAASSSPVALTQLCCRPKHAPWHYVSILVNCQTSQAPSHHHPHAPRKSSAESVQGILTCGGAARPTFTRRRAGSGHPTASTSGARPPWTARIASEASPSRCINDASRMGGAKRGGFSDARRNQRARARRR